MPTIIDVRYIFEVEHRYRGSRKSYFSSLSDVTPVEIEDISTGDAPIAMVQHPVKIKSTKRSSIPYAEWRDVGGRLFRPLEGLYRQHSPLDLQSVRELARFPTEDVSQHPAIRTPWRDNPFEVEEYTSKSQYTWMNPICRATPTEEFHLEIRSDKREEALDRVAEYARNLVLIDGAAWRLAREPVIQAHRHSFLSGAYLETSTSQELGVKNDFAMEYAFRADRSQEAAAFYNEILADSEIGPGRRNLKHLWDHDRLPEASPTARFEVLRPEVLKFDESAHCEHLLFSQFPIVIGNGKIQELWSLAPEALQGLVDLRKYGELPPGEGRLEAGIEALTRMIAAFPESIPESEFRNSTLNLLTTHACDLVDRINLMRSYAPSSDFNDGLIQLRT